MISLSFYNLGRLFPFFAIEIKIIKVRFLTIRYTFSFEAFCHYVRRLELTNFENGTLSRGWPVASVLEPIVAES